MVILSLDNFIENSFYSLSKYQVSSYKIGISSNKIFDKNVNKKVRKSVATINLFIVINLMCKLVKLNFLHST